MSGYNRVIIGLLSGLLAACAEKQELPPLPPRADLCIFYNSYRYSAAAAAVETVAALDAHNANESAYHERCLLDPDRPRGPR